MKIYIEMVEFLVCLLFILNCSCLWPRRSNQVPKITPSLCPGKIWFPFSPVKCFKLVKEPVTKYHASEKFGGSDGKLATIRTAEQTFVNQLVNNTLSNPVTIWTDSERSSVVNATYIWGLNKSKIEHGKFISDDKTLTLIENASHNLKCFELYVFVAI